MKYTLIRLVEEKEGRAGEVKLKFEHPERKDENRETELVGTAPPEPEFLKAIRALKADVLRICELPQEWGEELEVRSVAFRHQDNRFGVNISASRKLAAANSPLNITTPLLWQAKEDGQDKKVLSEEIVGKLNSLIQRAEEYEAGHRAQQELELDDEDDGQQDIEEAIAETEEEDESEAQEPVREEEPDYGATPLTNFDTVTPAALDALHHHLHGIQTVQDLALCTREEIGALQGIGETKLQRLDAILEAEGFAWQLPDEDGGYEPQGEAQADAHEPEVFAVDKEEPQGDGGPETAAQEPAEESAPRPASGNGSRPGRPDPMEAVLTALNEKYPQEVRGALLDRLPYPDEFMEIEEDAEDADHVPMSDREILARLQEVWATQVVDGHDVTESETLTGHVQVRVSGRPALWVRELDGEPALVGEDLITYTRIFLAIPFPSGEGLDDEDDAVAGRIEPGEAEEAAAPTS